MNNHLTIPNKAMIQLGTDGICILGLDGTSTFLISMKGIPLTVVEDFAQSNFLKQEGIHPLTSLCIHDNSLP